MPVVNCTRPTRTCSNSFRSDSGLDFFVALETKTMLSVIDAKAMLRQHEQQTDTTNLPARRMLNSAIARGATSLDAAVVKDVWAGLSAGALAERDALKVELAALKEESKVLKKEIDGSKEKLKCFKNATGSTGKRAKSQEKTILKCNKAFGGRLACPRRTARQGHRRETANNEGPLAALQAQRDAIEEKAESIEKDLARDSEKLEDTAKSMGEEGGWCSIM